MNHLGERVPADEFAEIGKLLRTCSLVGEDVRNVPAFAKRFRSIQRGRIVHGLQSIGRPVFVKGRIDQPTAVSPVLPLCCLRLHSTEFAVGIASNGSAPNFLPIFSTRL